MHPLTFSTPKGERTIGPGHPCFIIAELSANHGNDLDVALELVRQAAACGVDGVKLQTYTADTMTIDCPNRYFQIQEHADWKGETLYSLYKKASTPWSWHPLLKKEAEKLGITLFSSPFDPSSVEFLEELEVPLYKIASLESNYTQLLECVGKCGKPVILSRGLTPPNEIQEAIHTLYQWGAPSVAVLHCLSAYPAEAATMNLRTIPDLSTRFDVVSGLSDHSLSPTVPLAAVAIGASIVEKHFTLSRSSGGPDASFSLEPQEFKELVQEIRTVEAALGTPSYEFCPDEAKNHVFRRSIMVVRDVEEGETFTEENLRVIRPGFGLPPKELKAILGKKAQKACTRGTPLSWGAVDSSPGR